MPDPDHDPIGVLLLPHRRRWLIAGIVVAAGLAFLADLFIDRLGTGLALSLRLAASLGATLSFDSTPGQGTTARLWLPATSAAAL